METADARRFADSSAASQVPSFKNSSTTNRRFNVGRLTPEQVTGASAVVVWPKCVRRRTEDAAYCAAGGTGESLVRSVPREPQVADEPQIDRRGLQLLRSFLHRAWP